MRLKKVFRFVVVSLLVFFGVIVVFLAISIAPVDRTIDRHSLYEAMVARIDTLRATGNEDTLTFFVGYGKANITPRHRTATAAPGRLAAGKSLCKIRPRQEILYPGRLTAPCRV